MNRLVSLSAAMAAFVFSPAAMAGEGPEKEMEEASEEMAKAAEKMAEAVIETAEMEEVIEAKTREALATALATQETEASTPTPAKLVTFDGEQKFLNTSRRLRVWRANVGYTLTVDAEGKVTDCELTEKFRRTYVNQKLCEVLKDHHQFEPARDEEDAPVEGSYTSRLVYLDMRNKE